MEEDKTGIALSVCAKALFFSNFRKTTPTQFPLKEGISKRPAKKNASVAYQMTLSVLEKKSSFPLYGKPGVGRVSNFVF